jgi:pimeloyl-ACP methyl ester carboxylesterase
MENMLLLHGAIGSSQQLQPLKNLLEENYRVHSLNFHGHGGSDLPDSDFSIPAFAEQVIEYLDQQSIDKTNIFGYSMGGYVAMYLAKHYPARVQKIITLGTKFYWDEKVAEKEVPQLNANLIETKLPAFAAELKERHAPQDWKAVLEKTKTLLINLGHNNALHLPDYSGIENPCLVMLGDRDKMITLEETLQVYHHLPNAQFSVLPATPHPIEKANLPLLAYLIRNFC